MGETVGLPNPYSLLGFSPDLVDVRWIALDTLDACAHAWLETGLDDRERDVARRFRSDRDRHSYSAAHALVRLMLSQRAPIPPNRWRFMTDAQGKPELVLPAGYPRIRTSLSHTCGLVAAAVTVDHDVGVDVEDFSTDAFTIDVARNVLAPAEVEALMSVEMTQRRQMFGSLWTLKEAYAKAVGLGLTIPFQSFTITLEGAHASLSTPADQAGAWLMWHDCPTPSHALSVAVKHLNKAAVRVNAEAFGVNLRSPPATVGDRVGLAKTEQGGA